MNNVFNIKDYRKSKTKIGRDSKLNGQQSEGYFMIFGSECDYAVHTVKPSKKLMEMMANELCWIWMGEK